ncbi:MAG: hypothetical protein ACRD35_00410 [Candidatus Acidiferrales bacterium]
MKRPLFWPLAVVVLLLVVPALSVVGEPDLTQRFLLLATKKTSTMQKELSQAAAAGYRVLTGSPTSGTEMAIILEKVATPPNTYEYVLIATTRTSTMEKELNESAEKGFRLLPDTMISKPQMLGGIEIVVLMEKAPGPPKHYQYKLLATTLTSTMQKEMTQATEEGFAVVGMVSRDEHIVILERPAQ